MTVAQTGSSEAAHSAQTAASGSPAAASAARGEQRRTRRIPSPSPQQLHRSATDDEILGIDTRANYAHSNQAQSEGAFGTTGDGADAGDNSAESAAQNGDDSDVVAGKQSSARTGPPTDDQLQAALDAHPEARRAWEDAESYRESFSTPEEARAATALLSDLNRMDALFFSHRPEDHAELARGVAALDPAAFASLARAMNDLAANGSRLPTANEQGRGRTNESQQAIHQVTSQTRDEQNGAENRNPAPNQSALTGPSSAQVEFLHTANAAAVRGVLNAIETQVDRLLPEGSSKSARDRVVGEIYRELDASLTANRQLGQQMRDALRSGTFDAQHQRVLVSLVTGRARLALPAIVKRVLNEWTSTVVAANQDRLARQRTAAHRVDIAGSGRGTDGARRSLGPRDIDYARMSDSDILNL